MTSSLVILLEIFQRDSVPKQFQKLLKSRRMIIIAKHFLLRCLKFMSKMQQEVYTPT